MSQSDALSSRPVRAVVSARAGGLHHHRLRDAIAKGIPAAPTHWRRHGEAIPAGREGGGARVGSERQDGEKHGGRASACRAVRRDEECVAILSESAGVVLSTNLWRGAVGLPHALTSTWRSVLINNHLEILRLRLAALHVRNASAPRPFMLAPISHAGRTRTRIRLDAA